MTFELPKLDYAFNALEPYIDATTMKIHYTKHHQAYVTNLNNALLNYPEINYSSIEELLLNINNLPQEIQTAVRNNGGGHYNHSLFWKFLSPDKGQKPQGKLLDAINRDFGSFEDLKTQFMDAGKKLFGSGWVWLIKNHSGKLEIVTTPNQDSPPNQGNILLGVDLWEHAYYLNYQNRRPDYLFEIWNVINWRYVEERFENAI